MRNYRFVILAAAIGIGSSMNPSPVQARDTQTCEGWRDCYILRLTCAKGKGAYGQVDYPDGSIWGTCSF